MVKETNMQELYHTFRKSGIVKFTEFLDKRDKCQFCKENCGYSWCPVNQEKEKEKEKKDDK